MCGRYTITVTLDELMLRYLVYESTITDFRPKYNVAPMQFIPAIVQSTSGNRLGELRWGLVPSWAKDDKIGSKMINARAETLTEKPAFQRLLASRRCIIPADGFYEWKRDGNHKQPYRIQLRDGDIFSFAGLFDIWSDQQGNKIPTCTIITTEPNSLMANIHNRMPVILHQEDETEWLDRANTEIPVLTKLLKPYDANKMRAYRVTTAVGNVRNDTKELIEEIG
ncbi:SOS response-associated peptidase [Fontibacillus sp. BL9]|uniref:SOS response-associated peptidase n=1 Tax=Fontibacillus sp. BL9 TaxID=3389971 RepID=UPI00397D8D10